MQRNSSTGESLLIYSQNHFQVSIHSLYLPANIRLGGASKSRRNTRTCPDAFGSYSDSSWQLPLQVFLRACSLLFLRPQLNEIMLKLIMIRFVIL